MIEITNLEKTYQMGDEDLPILKGISLKIEAGDFVAIMGPSGSGKSTLMHILGLLDVPTRGSYKLLGHEVSGLDEDELARLRNKKIGFIFQQFNLLSRTTAEDNVGLPMIYNTGHHDSKRAIELLQRVGLGERKHHKPNELSGGQQQRVAIARALMNAPDIIFADEPTGNLDSTSEREVMRILAELNALGITIILVTHEPEIAKYVKRVVRVRDGLIQSDERNSEFQAAVLEGEKMAALSPVKTTAAHFFARLFTSTSVYVKQALRALVANKIRTLLSMLGIMVGVAAVIAMLALGTGARESIKAQMSALGSNILTVRPGANRPAGGIHLGAGAVSRLVPGDADVLAKIPGVAAAAASLSGRAQIVFGNKNWNTNVLGTGTAYEVLRAATPTIGRFFTPAEDKERARVAVIGATLVRELFGDRSPIGEIIKINRMSFRVIGVLPEKGSNSFRDQDDVVVIPLTTAMKRLFGKNFVESIDVQMTRGDLADNITEAIVAVFTQRYRLPEELDGNIRVQNMAEIQEAMSQTSRVMSWLLAAIASISLLVGGIGIMNIMLVAVAERTREIGLRKALGATRSTILAQFLVEAMTVSMAGGLIGVAMGWGIAQTMAMVAGWAVKVEPNSIILSLLFSGAIGVAFGLWPAKKAAQLQPIQALRHD